MAFHYEKNSPAVYPGLRCSSYVSSFSMKNRCFDSLDQILFEMNTFMRDILKIFYDYFEDFL